MDRIFPENSHGFRTVRAKVGVVDGVFPPKGHGGEFYWQSDHFKYPEMLSRHGVSQVTHHPAGQVSKLPACPQPCHACPLCTRRLSVELLSGRPQQTVHSGGMPRRQPAGPTLNPSVGQEPRKRGAAYRMSDGGTCL